MPESEKTAVSTIAKALNDLRAKVTHVEKTGSNPHFRYDYVEESHLMSTVRQAMIDVGLVLTPQVVGEVQVFTETGKDRNLTTVVFVQEYHLAHVSGAHWPWPISVVAAGQDINDKHVWKASTGANKYAIMRLLQLATGDDPEQDHGLGSSSGSSRPASRPAKPRPTKGRPPARGSSNVAEILAKEDPDEVASREILKACGVWAACFKAAESAHGKGEEHKFKVVDAFCDSHGMRSSNQLRVKHIEPLLQFAASYSGDDRAQEPPPPEDDGYYEDLPE